MSPTAATAAEDSRAVAGRVAAAVDWTVIAYNIGPTPRKGLASAVRMA
ncbi:hypothetical protein I6A60_01000 [Frankia sp. AgB1.9]|nr:MULTISPECIES: hypothetical protein [unclassified Frankia]MBL7546465.1 hypothetical protein [Frankia sp. AgB1.9]MBL7620276.1 hypothetical protein [Frankia sp. AgB1.8]